MPAYSGTTLLPWGDCCVPNSPSEGQFIVLNYIVNTFCAFKMVLFPHLIQSQAKTLSKTAVAVRFLGAFKNTELFMFSTLKTTPKTMGNVLLESKHISESVNINTHSYSFHCSPWVNNQPSSLLISKGQCDVWISPLVRNTLSIRIKNTKPNSRAMELCS